MPSDHCVKSLRILSFSGPHFPAFALNTEICRENLIYLVRMQGNKDQKNSKYRHFSRTEGLQNTSRFGSSFAAWLFYFCNKGFKKTLKLQKMSNIEN